MQFAQKHVAVRSPVTVGCSVMVGIPVSSESSMRSEHMCQFSLWPTLTPCSCNFPSSDVSGCSQGINYGGGDGKSQEIKLRLRRTDNVEAFYEFEDLLLVMLHELTHNVHGPHNQPFYKLLDEITAVSPRSWFTASCRN